MNWMSQRKSTVKTKVIAYNVSNINLAVKHTLQFNYFIQRCIIAETNIL